MASMSTFTFALLIFTNALVPTRTAQLPVARGSLEPHKAEAAAARAAASEPTPASQHATDATAAMVAPSGEVEAGDEDDSMAMLQIETLLVHADGSVAAAATAVADVAGPAARAAGAAADAADTSAGSAADAAAGEVVHTSRTAIAAAAAKDGHVKRFVAAARAANEGAHTAHEAVALPQISTQGGHGNSIAWDEAFPGFPATSVMFVCVAFIVLLGVALPQKKVPESAHKRYMVASGTVAAKCMAHTEADPYAGEQPLSAYDATVATFSTIMGTGLLAMPYAFSLAGMVAAPLIIFFVCCSVYTAHLMSWTLSAQMSQSRLRDSSQTGLVGWAHIVERAFGPKAGFATNVFLFVELWGYELTYIVITSMNVNQLMQSLSMPLTIIISTLAGYALTFVPTRLLTQVNVVANIVFFACCAMFLVTGLYLPEKAPVADIEVVKPQGVLSALGLLMFSPAAHAFYPVIQQRMEEPTKYPSCVRWAYGAACVLYLVVAIPGYYLFGNATRPSVIMNIGVDLQMRPIPHLEWMNTAAALGMAAKLLALQPLVIVPLLSSAERLVPRKFLEVLPMGPSGLAPLLLGVSALVASRFAHQMALLLNVLGSVFCMNIAFIVPVLCYWKLAEGPISWAQRLTLLGLLVIGGSCVVLGSIASFVG